MSRVFLSHASKEHGFAMRVVEGLERCNLPCWIAPRDIPTGADFQKSLFDAIKNCDIILLLLSDHSNRSEEVAREMALARRFSKTIVPARLQDVEPENALGFQLTAAQRVDLFRDFDANLSRLSRDLGKVLKLSDQVAAAQVRAGRQRRLARVGIGLILGVAFAAAAWLILLPVTSRVASAPPGSSVFGMAVAGPAVTATLPEKQALPDNASDDPLHRFVDDYYRMMSKPGDDAIDYLRTIAVEPLNFYGRSITKQKLLGDEQSYLQRWPQRRFIVRPASIRTTCDASGASCVVGGMLDYDVRNPAADQAHWGTERFQMQLLRLGGALQLTGLSSTPVERHSGTASSDHTQ